MNRGFSLIELLVASVLALGVLTLLSLVIVQTTRVSARGVAIGQLQQSGVTAMLRVMADLQSTNSGGLSILSSGGPTQPTVVAMDDITGVTSDARPLYDTQNMVAYVWHPDTGQLLRRAWLPMSSPPALSIDQPTRLSATQLGLLASQPNGSQTQVAAQVTAFSLYSPVPPPAIGSPLVIQISLAQQAVSQVTETFSLSRSVVLRNGL